MKNTQNITICLLTVSAVILTAMLVGIYVNTSRQADAHISVKQGQYIMCTGTWSRSYDLVYIINIATGGMNAYVYNKPTRRLQNLDKTDLNAVFGKLRVDGR